MKKKKRIRVLCVDDSSDIVELYSELLNSEPDLECVGRLLSAQGLVEEVKRTKPDVVVLDLSMPGPSPLQTIAFIAQSHPEARVLLCSGYDDEHTANAAYEAGAWGLVSKHDPTTALLEAIRKVFAGEVSFRYLPA